MQKFYLLVTILTLIVLTSCSKKTVPTKTNEPSIEYKYDSSAVDKTTVEEISEVKKAPVKKTKATYPKIITVNDAAAKKSVDGRMYYDIQGRRYWKNFKDGKYYLFDKSMYNNPDFKPTDG
ncbi:MAG: hypothetical protein ABIW47_06535 [Ginsengibacter sp.]